jgi:glycerol-3-phosphate dehydrogenase (NAD(P)+)
MNITIVGAGSWGIGLASLLTRNLHTVKMWSHCKEEVDMINTNHQIDKYLPGYIIPKEIVVYNDLEKALEGAEMIVMAVPSIAVRECAKKVNQYKKDCIVVDVAKGIEESTLKRLSEVIEEEMPEAKVVTLSGPSHAEEVVKNNPTAVTVACKEPEIRQLVASVFRNEFFRVYPNEDIIGVEVGGALKNIIAVCTGISDGLGLGDNAKAGLITRGLAEITRLAVKMGANPETLFGLSGMGDLVVTCGSKHSRNYRAGLLIGQGNDLKTTLDKICMVVEGVNTTKAGKKLGEKYGVELPIIEKANEILFEGKDPRTAVLELMTRKGKEEYIVEEK